MKMEKFYYEESKANNRFAEAEVKAELQEMSEEEIIKIVNEVFEELKPSSMKDMGNLMKVISSKITNADMSLVSKIVKDKLLS